jgi:hypothetical protein
VQTCGALSSCDVTELVCPLSAQADSFDSSTAVRTTHEPLAGGSA